MRELYKHGLHSVLTTLHYTTLHCTALKQSNDGRIGAAPGVKFGTEGSDTNTEAGSEHHNVNDDASDDSDSTPQVFTTPHYATLHYTALKQNEDGGFGGKGSDNNVDGNVDAAAAADGSEDETSDSILQVFTTLHYSTLHYTTLKQSEDIAGIAPCVDCNASTTSNTPYRNNNNDDDDSASAAGESDDGLTTDQYDGAMSVCWPRVTHRAVWCAVQCSAV